MKIKNRFQIDCLPDHKFIGTQDPMVKWNGFDCPTFPVEEARRICAKMMNESDLEATTYNDPAGFITTTCEGETEHWKIFGDECDLGSYAWCWGSDLSWTVGDLIGIDDVLSEAFTECLQKLRRDAGIVHVDVESGTFFESPLWLRGTTVDRLEICFRFIEKLQELSDRRGNVTGQYFTLREFHGKDHEANARLFVKLLKEHHGFDAPPILCGEDYSSVDMDNWPDGEAFTEWFDDFAWQHGIHVVD